MRLEKLVKKILMPAIVSSAIFFASCGGPSSDGKAGKNSNSPNSNGGTQTVQSHVVSVGDVSGYSPSTGTIYFSSPVNFNNGEIVSSGITSAAPNGFLRKISWMSQDKKTAYTQAETLEDAVKDTGKNIRIVINPTQLHPANARFFPARTGINSLNYYGGYDFGTSLENFVIFDLDGNQNTTNDQLKAKGYILFNTGFSTVLNIEKNLPPYFSFENLSDGELMLEINSENSFNNLSKKILIGEFLFEPIVIGYIPTAVPIPIIAVPRDKTYLNFSGDISAMRTSINQSASVTGGIEYNQGWNFSKTFSKSFYFAPPNLPKSANFRASLSQRLDILLYGIAGAYGEVGGILDFHLNGSSWELHEGLEALIGVDGDILGNSFDYSKKVLEFDELLASGSLGAGGGSESTLTDSRDNQTYNVVQIGNQSWMAENLNYNSPNSKCYNDDQNNCNIYGRLYSLDEAISYCPSRWHLPANSEWSALFNYLGGSTVAGGKMKEAGFSHWNSPNAGATNESGFSGLPGGYILIDIHGSYIDFYKNSRTYFWGADGKGNGLFYDAENVGWIFSGSDNSKKRFSVRCVKN